jgi:cardiolipin synthase A/B
MKLIIQPEAGIQPIVQAIRKAQKKLEICIFRFDRDEIAKEIIAAVQRGVKVRTLIANTNSGGEKRLRALEQRLLEAGVMVSRSAGDLLRYHGKYIVSDGTLHLLAFNFTKADIDHSRSFGISTKDRRAVCEASKLFEADTTRQAYVPASSTLVVSPETSRAMLTKFIKGARKELAIYDAKVQDPAMIRLLKDRCVKGVKIRVIGSVKGPDGGIEARKLTMRLHVRAIIRDGTRAFVGSQSLRTPELDSRREVGQIVSNAAVARGLMQVFERDWEESRKAKGDSGKGKKDKETKKAKAKKLKAKKAA